MGTFQLIHLFQERSLHLIIPFDGLRLLTHLLYFLLLTAATQLILNGFNLLLQVKELLAEHCDQATIAKRTGLQSFVVRNYIPMSRQYAAEELKAAVNDCVQMEEDVKTGKISDLLSVELLITKYSRAA